MKETENLIFSGVRLIFISLMNTKSCIFTSGETKSGIFTSGEVAGGGGGGGGGSRVHVHVTHCN